MMSTSLSKPIRQVTVLAVIAALTAPAFSFSVGEVAGGEPELERPAQSPSAGEREDGTGIGTCYEVIYGDWKCTERWLFGCLTWHCVYPGEECSIYIPIPCPDEGSGSTGDQNAQRGS